MTRTYALILGLILSNLMLASPVFAKTLIAARTIPARTIIAPTDVSLVESKVAGVHNRVEDVVGLETRVTLYAGRPVKLGDLGPAAVIDRNEVVLLRFRTGALVIETDGRAMDRAAVGAGVRVMNLGSRLVVVGRVFGPGVVEVGQ